MDDKAMACGGLKKYSDTDKNGLINKSLFTIVCSVYNLPTPVSVKSIFSITSEKKAFNI